jgi:TMEM175 potassium channel family protein
VGKARLEAFSDGVFAIAITLLVLTIPTPEDFRHLGDALVDQWPAYAAYAVSFAVIGIMWLNHHTVFSHFERVDRNLVYLNLVLLATVVFVPYPTGIFGEALQRGDGERVAAVFYSVVMTLNAISWAALWLYGSGRRRLLGPTFPEDQRRTASVLFTFGTLIYAGTIVVGLVNAYACLAVHGALAVYYALDPLSRWVARLTE